MPNKEKTNNLNDPEAIPGVIVKGASVSSTEVTDEELKKINKYTISPLTKEEVFVFKAVLADNEQDDRNYTPFNLKSLKDLKKLYLGKTMLKDHYRSVNSQIGRIYATELVENPNKVTELGEPHTELVAKMYMVKTESNKDLITEIKAGIKKEVSTSTKADKLKCNICKGDGLRCRHWPGMTYTVEDGTEQGEKRVCKFLIDGVKEAYELSFVAVPAQPRAGTTKCAGFAKMPFIEKEKNKDETQKDERILKNRVRILESFLITQKEREVEKDE